MKCAYTGHGKYTSAAVDESALEFQRSHAAPPPLDFLKISRAADKINGPNPFRHNRKNRMANAREYLIRIALGQISDPLIIKNLTRDYSNEFALLKAQNETERPNS